MKLKANELIIAATKSLVQWGENTTNSCDDFLRTFKIKCTNEKLQ